MGTAFTDIAPDIIHIQKTVHHSPHAYQNPIISIPVHAADDCIISFCYLLPNVSHDSTGHCTFAVLALRNLVIGILHHSVEDRIFAVLALRDLVLFGFQDILSILLLGQLTVRVFTEVPICCCFLYVSSNRVFCKEEAVIPAFKGAQLAVAKSMTSKSTGAWNRIVNGMGVRWKWLDFADFSRIQ